MSRTTAATSQRFHYEASLVNRLIKLLPKYARTRGANHRIITEMPVGRGIADVVVGIWNELPVAPAAPLSLRESVILSTLRQCGQLSMEELEHRCGLLDGALRNDSLNRLLSWALIEKRQNIIDLNKCDWLSQISIIAIEAKLVDWRPAQEQALRYQKYANETHVALPHEQATHDSLDKESFSATGIGLITVGRALIIEIPALPSCLGHDWRREFAASRLIASGRHVRIAH
jgi:hypothetical protein